jgi:hypothetical protein
MHHDGLPGGQGTAIERAPKDVAPVETPGTAHPRLPVAAAGARDGDVTLPPRRSRGLMQALFGRSRHG